MAGNSGIRWEPGSAAQVLLQFPEKADRALTAIIHLRAPQIEASMKNGAPWTDQTSNARNGLFAKAVREKGKRYAIVAGHSVDYGIWLEIAMTGRFAIVIPTLRNEGPPTMALAATLFERMFG